MKTIKKMLSTTVLFVACSLLAQETAPVITDSPSIEEEPSLSEWSFTIAGDYFDFESGTSKVVDLIQDLNEDANSINLQDRTGELTGGTVSLGWKNQLFFDFSFASGDSDSTGTSNWGGTAFDEVVTFSEDWNKLRVRWDIGALSGEHFKGYLSGGYQVMSGNANYSYNVQGGSDIANIVDLESDAQFMSLGVGIALNQPAGAFNIGVVGEIQGVFGKEDGTFDPQKDASYIGLSDNDFPYEADEIFGLEYTVTGYVNYPFAGGAVFLNVGYRTVSWGDDGGDSSGIYNDGDLKGVVGRLGVKFNF